jgi:hypothetical protein
MSMSDILENEILDHIFGCGTLDYTPPADIFVALSTADPGEDGASIAEPSGLGYARQQTDEADWNTAASGSVDNATQIAFPVATGDWTTITHFAFFTLITGGVFLGSAVLDAPKDIDTDDTAVFEIGDLAATLT